MEVFWMAAPHEVSAEIQHQLPDAGVSELLVISALILQATPASAGRTRDGLSPPNPARAEDA